MKIRTLKQLLLYDYRYLFAYGVVFGFIAYFLGWQLQEIGPGISQSEMAAAARHVSLAALIELPVNPLHSLLQWASIEFIGINTLALRLPSILIALLVALCLYNLLKKWFGKQTALLSTALLVSADWFLFTARLGTGSIEFSLWLVTALLCLTKLIEHKTRWLIPFSAALSMLLFAPFGLYVSITLLLSIILCQLFRERIKEASLLTKTGCFLILAASLAAAIATSVHSLDFIKHIAGITSLPTVVGFFQNIFFGASSIVAVFPDASPATSPSGILFVRFFELIFILFGVVMLWRTRVNRLNLVILVLSAVLVMVGGLSTNSRSGSILLIPAAIYMTAGIRHLMHRWKRTFPKNPYARMAAYIPLGILFLSVVGVHYVSYFQLWPNQTDTHAAFSKDLPLLASELARPEYAGKSCFVESDNTDIKQLIGASKPQCNVIYENPAMANALIIRPGSSLFQPVAAPRALVRETRENNVRWLVVNNQPVN